MIIVTSTVILLHNVWSVCGNMGAGGFIPFLKPFYFRKQTLSK
ncbi:hypothetical protein ACQKMD_05000 [Viridibacillus sp. NPDC096237]